MKIRNLILSALLLGAFVSAPAFAGPVIDWDPAYVYGPGASATVVVPGAELRGVGIVSMFDGPLGFLDANDPNKEYTFVFRGLIANPTVVSGPPAFTFYTTNYNGGIIELYEGTPRNSSFAPNPTRCSMSRSPTADADGLRSSRTSPSVSAFFDRGTRARLQPPMFPNLSRCTACRLFQKQVARCPPLWRPWCRTTAPSSHRLPDRPTTHRSAHRNNFLWLPRRVSCPPGSIRLRLRSAAATSQAGSDRFRSADS